MNAGCLFDGIGGFPLGLERAGVSVVWQAENDPFACKVLKKHWPDIPNLGDVTKIDWSTVERPDILCGGFPCQDISSAHTSGTREGLHGAKSGLYWCFSDAIRVIRPRWVVIENSPQWRRWAPDVRADLSGLGYRSILLLLSAGSFGAPHRRPRGLVVANTDRHGESLRAIHAEASRLSPLSELHQPNPWSTPARTVGVGNGFPGGVDRRSRLKALGNALVPQVAEWIGRQIIAQHPDEER